ncbi:Aste57867_14919 [Aphanomyces stellatus]|uniref:Aste57867_14919 protein n=1 Tax=Aphanomyces stellatus TaxID=120398 RepID=A0A485L4J7_9STRA|nr:hypothetical protein As57867_014863 [Aphanomyces stellatus]VFT91734.1 Aste57867_14919 [Aphanomyces stellatus]
MKLVGDPKEVIVVDEGLTDLDGLLVQDAVHLNFNRLTQLRHDGLEHATNLKLLNIMHNQIQSLDGIEGLTSLRVLKVSHNKLTSLQQVAALSQLTELWVSSNRLDLSALHVLKTVPSLRTLLIEANPLFIIGLLPWIERLDTTVVTDDMRARAAAFLGSHEGKALVKQSAAPATPLTTGKPARNTAPRPTSEQRKQDENDSDDVARPSKPVSAPHMHRTTSSVKAPTKDPAKTPKPLQDFLEAYPVQDYIPAMDTPALDALSTMSIADAIGGLPIFSSNSSTTPATTTKCQPKPKASKGVKAKTQTTRLKPPTPPSIEPLAPFPSPIIDTTNPEVDDDDVLDMEQYKPKAAAPPATQPPPTSTQPELTVKYSGSNVTAVAIRPNGSATCRWPNNTIALTVDAEPPSGFRIFGTYKDGSVALSFDSHGVGFVNYANGKTMMSTTSAGDGLFCGAGGGIERQWSAASSSVTTTTIAVKLSDDLGLSYSPRALEVYFVSHGVRRCVMHGFNSSTGAPSTAAMDAVMGHPIKAVAPGTKKKPPRLAHGDLVSEIRRCTAQL